MVRSQLVILAVSRFLSSPTEGNPSWQPPFPILSSPQPLAAANVFSISTDLPIVAILYKWTGDR